MTFKEWVIQKRSSIPMTQEELAQKAKISVRAVQAIEQGRVDDPRVSTVRAIEQALGESFFAQSYQYNDKSPVTP